MALYKRGKYWHYDFWFEGIRYQKSTKQRAKRGVSRIESAVKTDLGRRQFTLPSKSLQSSELFDKYAEVAKTYRKRAYVTEKYNIASHLARILARFSFTRSTWKLVKSTSASVSRQVPSSQPLTVSSVH